MHEMLRWKHRPPRYVPQEGFLDETAQRIFRMQGPDAYEEYLKLFQPEPPETNLPKLQVCKSCVYFRETIPTCIYEQRDGKNTEDVAEFDGDDPYDGGRYLIKAYHRYIRESKQKHEKQVTLGTIIQKLEETGDYNTFHRQMHHFEQKFIHKSRSIHRTRSRSRAKRYRAG
jgi:hypothetical protein